MKQDYSYIVAPRTLENTLKAIQSAVSRTQRYMNQRQEGTKEIYLSYLENGHDHIIKERKRNMEAYFERTNTPEYLRATQMETALENLGERNLLYWNQLPDYIPIRCNVNGKPFEIDFENDVNADPITGEWIISNSLIERVSKIFTKELSDDEVTVIAKVDKLAELYREIKDNGYDIAESLDGWHEKSNSSKAEVICNSYNALFDKQVNESEKAKIKANQQKFYNVVG